MLEERRFPRGFGHSQSCLSALLEDTTHDQFARIPAVVEDTIVRLFGGEGVANESCPDTKVLPVTRRGANRSVALAS